MFQAKKDNFLESFREVDITLSKKIEFWYPGKYVNYITLDNNEKIGIKWKFL